MVENIQEIYQEIEEAIYHIERNGNGNVILTDLSIKLTRLLHKKKRYNQLTQKKNRYIMNPFALLLLAFLAITFLQSGLDKILDWNGNVSWLKVIFHKLF